MGTNDHADPGGGGHREDFVAPVGSRHFMLNLFLVSLAILFLATLAAFILFRFRIENWPPAGMPAFPVSMWLSTVLIITCSILLQLGIVNIRRGKPQLMKSLLGVTLVLGLAFLVNQVIAWSGYIGLDTAGQANLYKFSFYMLIALHGLHLIGGIIPLVGVNMAAGRGMYTEDSHEGVELLVKYWHFLGAVWIMIYLTLMATA